MKKKDRVINEIVDLIDGRYEGMKNLLETPENERINTTREVELMLGEIKIIKDCVDIIIKYSNDIIIWLNGIDDDKLHHIGEYYTYCYDKPWRKLSTDGLTKGCFEWLIQEDLDSMGKIIMSNGFEILRDNRPPAFYIQKKSNRNVNDDLKQMV